METFMGWSVEVIFSFYTISEKWQWKRWIIFASNSSLNSQPSSRQATGCTWHILLNTILNHLKTKQNKKTDRKAALCLICSHFNVKRPSSPDETAMLIYVASARLALTSCQCFRVAWNHEIQKMAEVLLKIFHPVRLTQMRCSSYTLAS